MFLCCNHEILSFWHGLGYLQNMDGRLCEKWTHPSRCNWKMSPYNFNRLVSQMRTPLAGCHYQQGSYKNCALWLNIHLPYLNHQIGKFTNINYMIFVTYTIVGLSNSTTIIHKSNQSTVTYRYKCRFINYHITRTYDINNYHNFPHYVTL